MTVLFPRGQPNEASLRSPEDDWATGNEGLELDYETQPRREARNRMTAKAMG